MPATGFLLSCITDFGGIRAAHANAVPSGQAVDDDKILVVAQPGGDDATLIEAPQAGTASNLLGSILRQVPNAVPNDARGAIGFPFAIRGVTSQSSGAGVQQSVAVYLDGVYQGGDVGLRLLQSDIAYGRVESGPSGLEFARSALAGTIDLVSRIPESRNIFETDVGLATGGGRDARVYINLASAGGQSAINLSALYASDSGQGMNLTTGTPIDAISLSGLRVRGRLNLGRTTELELGAALGRERDHAPASRLLLINPAPSGLPGINAAALLPEDFARLPDGAIAQNVDPFEDLTSSQLWLRVNTEVGSVAATVQLASRGYGYRRVFDGDGTNADLLRIELPEDYRLKTVQLRVKPVRRGKLSWLLGVAYSREWSRNEGAIFARPTLLSLYNDSFALPFPADQEAPLRADGRMARSIGAVQAKVRYAPGAGLSFEGWAHWSSERHDLNISQGSFGAAQVLLGYPTFGDYREGRRYSDLSPGLKIALKVGEGVTARIGLGRGFKSGSLSQTFVTGASPDQAGLGYAPERLWNYEIGLDVRSRRIAAVLTVFLADWRGRQIENRFVSQDLATTRTINCCDLRGWGFEGNVDFRATDGISLRVAGGFNRYQVLRSSLTAVPVGSRLSETPGWTVTASANATFTLLSKSGHVEINGHAMGGYDLFAPGTNKLRQGAAASVDVNVSLQLLPEVMMQVWAENITGYNSIYAADQSTYQLPWLGSVKYYLGGSPRRLGLRVRLSR